MSRFEILVVVVVLVVSGVGWYVVRRARTVFGLGGLGLVLLGSAVFASPILLFYGRHGFAEGVAWATPMAIVGAAGALSTLFAGLLLVHVDVIRKVARRVQRFRRPDATPASEVETKPAAVTKPASVTSPHAKSPDPEPPVEPAIPGLTRRETLASGAALLSGAAFGGYAAFFGRHAYVVEEVVIPLPGLPRTLEGFTLAQISDVHIGQFVGAPELRAAEALIRDVGADLIVMTGDLVDHEERFAPDLGRFVRRLEPLAPHGVAAIPGNHDYYSGIDAVLGALRRGGARVLRNSGRVIVDSNAHGADRAGFALVGVDDLWSSGGPDLDRALAMVRPGIPRVLLCHQPEFFHDNAHRVQLQLSGHTHGGQVSLGYEPAGLFIPHGYVEGVYRRSGGTLYVNRGFGTAGPPARLGAAPEITKIVLTRA